MNLGKILSPYQIKPEMNLRNRIVMAPLNMQYSLFDGQVSLNDIEFHRERSKRTGLDIIGSVYVSDSGNSALGSMSIADDNKIVGLSKLVDVIHANGSKVIPQLIHAGRMTSQLITKGNPVVAPSAIKANHGDFDRPVEMTKSDIMTIIDDFEQATLRAIKAGFDGIEIHGANTFLIQQFMSPNANQRTDEFGGNLNNRLKFPILLLNRILRVIKENTKQPFIVGYRISPEEFEPNGLSFADNLMLIKVLETLGIDYISLSMMKFDQKSKTNEMLKDYSIAEVVKKAVAIPVMVSGELGNVQGLKNSVGDLFAIGRQFLNDPNWLCNISKKIRQTAPL